MPTALVTGASRGLGLELCRQLLARGCSVIAACRDTRAGKSAGLDALQGGLKGGATLKVVVLDVAQRESVLALARWLEAEAVALDFLFNNAGVALARDAQLEDPPLDAAMTTFLTNVVGPHSCLSAFLPALARAAGGAGRSGSSTSAARWVRSASCPRTSRPASTPRGGSGARTGRTGRPRRR